MFQASQESIYTDELGAGWADWSWSTERNLANTLPVQTGSKSIAVAFNSPWAGFYLHKDGGVSTAGFSHLQFFVHGGAAGGQLLRLIANQNGDQAFAFSPSANAWTAISVPLSALGSPAALTDLVWGDASGAVQPDFYLDSIALTGGPSASTATPVPSSTPEPSEAPTNTPVDGYPAPPANMTPIPSPEQAALTRKIFLPAVIQASKSVVVDPTPTPSPTPTTPPKSGAVIFSDSLSAGIQSWSWNVTVDAAATSPVQVGSRSMAVTITGGWGALRLHSEPAMNITGYNEISFWINGGSGNQQLVLQLNEDQTTRTSVTASANTWKQVRIPLSQLGSPSSLSDLYLQDATGGAQPVFYLDEISFGGTAAPTPTPPTGSGPSLSIDAASGVHAIKPEVYGMNWAPEALAAELKLPVNRWGGNAVTRYNYQYNNFNRAADWYFMNVPDSDMSADAFAEQNRRTGTNTILTVPLIGWTPKDATKSCGFAVAKYGAQQYAADGCGNGIRPDGSVITGNDPRDTSIPVTPAFIQGWLGHLTGLYGTAANGGVKYYSLDNEPMLWNHTHRDVHPDPASYDEMRDRTYTYAAAVKAADPSAKTLGPVLWGWTAYFYSAKDGVAPSTWNNPLDRNAHGGVPFVEWYLQQMKAYEQQHGVRILDYLDLHYYPQGSNIFSNAVDTATQALRLRSTRALWDPTYTDESWINDKVQLIPRMKGWVNSNYPGTKTALTEYNWGALNHINGALAQADVLGIFGREGIDLATLWAGPKATDPGAYAFRMYRNYDGAGSMFGGTSVKAASSNQDQLAVYAATRSSDGALTIMVINKTGGNLTSSISLANFNPSGAAKVYRYSAANLNAIVRQGDQASSGGSFSTTFPANSITLFVFPK